MFLQGVALFAGAKIVCLLVCAKKKVSFLYEKFLLRLFSYFVAILCMAVVL